MRYLFVICILLYSVNAQAINFKTDNAGPGISGQFIDLQNGYGSGIDIPLGRLVIGATYYDLSGAGPPVDSNGSALLNFVYSSTENVFTITGGVPDVSIPDWTILLSGSFDTFEIIPTKLNDGIRIEGMGDFLEAIVLRDKLGVPDAYMYGLEMSIPNFDVGVDIPWLTRVNSIEPDLTPEPATIALVGIGLLSLPLLRKRK
jgi:hypothetical protein